MSSPTHSARRRAARHLAVDLHGTYAYPLWAGSGAAWPLRGGRNTFIRSLIYFSPGTRIFLSLYGQAPCDDSQPASLLQNVSYVFYLKYGAIRMGTRRKGTYRKWVSVFRSKVRHDTPSRKVYHFALIFKKYLQDTLLSKLFQQNLKALICSRLPFENQRLATLTLAISETVSSHFSFGSR